jgi:hypothetical protein
MYLAIFLKMFFYWTKIFSAFIANSAVNCYPQYAG